MSQDNAVTPGAMRLVDVMSTIKGMPCRSTLVLVVASLGVEWCERTTGETDRRWACRMLSAAGNRV